jgi:hypothetical protein
MASPIGISFEGIGGLVSGLGSAAKDIRAAITGKSVTDSQAQAELDMKLAEIQQKALEAENALALAQMEINKAEAASGDKFSSRWRPSVGWIGTLGFAWIALLNPMASWLAVVVFNYTGTMPAVDSQLVLTVLGGLLGFGGMRTAEYFKGVMKK